MICKACATAADIQTLLKNNKLEGEERQNLYSASRVLHSFHFCMGEGHCDCQHKDVRVDIT